MRLEPRVETHVTALPSGHLQVVDVTIVEDHDVTPPTPFGEPRLHRYVLTPGDPLDREAPLTQRIAAVVWTPAVLAAFAVAPDPAAPEVTS
jgi:hypothetical protein